MKLRTVYWQAPNGTMFEWDPAKAVLNLRNHRISFPYATRVFLDPYRQQQLDTREEYGEDRWIVLGRVERVDSGGRIHPSWRANIRLISARKANQSENEVY
jgi:uncharacterized DUF497 family protein